MLTIKECREILCEQANHMTDEDIEKYIETVYFLGDIVVEQYFAEVIQSP